MWWLYLPSYYRLLRAWRSGRDGSVVLPNLHRSPGTQSAPLCSGDKQTTTMKDIFFFFLPVSIAHVVNNVYLWQLALRSHPCVKYSSEWVPKVLDDGRAGRWAHRLTELASTSVDALPTKDQPSLYQLWQKKRSTNWSLIKQDRFPSSPLKRSIKTCCYPVFITGYLITFEDVLSYEFCPVWPVLDLMFEQVTHFGPLELLALLVEWGWRLESCFGTQIVIICLTLVNNNSNLRGMIPWSTNCK